MGVGVREAGVCVSVSWGAVVWLDVLCTVLFTVVMFVGGGGWVYWGQYVQYLHYVQRVWIVRNFYLQYVQVDALRYLHLGDQY